MTAPQTSPARESPDRAGERHRRTRRRGEVAAAGMGAGLTDGRGRRKLCYCLVGAMQAAGPSDMARAAYRAVQDELRWRGEELSLSRFNDLHAASVDDVLAVLEAAKARLS